MHSSLSLLYTNLASSLSKFDEFTAVITNIAPDIVFVTETWLTSGITDPLVNLTNYTLYREDRSAHRPDGKTKKGGGTAIYIKNEIKGHQVISVRQDNLIVDATDIEVVWIKAKINTLELVLGCIYRPPSSTCSQEDNRKVCQAINRINELNDTTIVFGDLNYPEINWTVGNLDKNCPLAAEFLESYQDSGIHQLVTFPTRYRENNTPSLLDLLLTTDDRLVTSIESHPPVGKSDHVVITATIQVYLENIIKQKPARKNYWKADYDQINSYILD